MCKWLKSLVCVSENVVILFFLFSCQVEIPEDISKAYDDLPQTLDFNFHVKPILSDKCFACHGPDSATRKAGLRLDLESSATTKLTAGSGNYAVVPGNLRKSQLFHRITSNDPELAMPPDGSNLTLTAYEKAVLIKWLEDGAEYKPHWAFIPPLKGTLPEVQDKYHVNNHIDRFILKQLENRGLKPSAEADKTLLLRRLSLDLTGLPPEPEEIYNFLADTTDNAYEKQVDRLLSSPHFGEKMAVDWMDLARYADTHGYLVDRYRDMSPWRDWVIRAFNENMAYDQFVTWQLAGDLLANPTREQILATGFNRLHPQNLEGGIIDEEFRVEYVADRANVLGKGLMAMTVGCARCHDHKYDPISQKNYYQLFSFFNNVNETGQISWEGATPVPTLMLPTDQQEKILDMLSKMVEEKEKMISAARDQEASSVSKWLAGGGYKNLTAGALPKGAIAHFELENPRLANKLKPWQRGKMARRFSSEEKPVFTEGFDGKGLLLDGDAWLDLDKIGIFKRNQPFSIGLNVFLPQDIENGVILHKGLGTRLHSFRGYHLRVKDNKMELLMAHTWPDNAIVEHSLKEVPKDQWINLTITYDGSSKAAGYKLYLNGQEMQTKIEIDNLYKDIIFNDMEDPIYEGKIEPGLQIGGRWRGKGIGDAIVDDVMVFKRELSGLEVMQIAAPDAFDQLAGKEPNDLTRQESSLLTDYYFSNLSRDYQTSLAELEKVREIYIDSMEQVKEVMVMKEMPQRRKAFLLERGLYNSYGEEVFPNVLEKVLPMPDDLPKNRLGLAQWLFSTNNPLTARVAVNRYWQNFFGMGIVRTTEDFGNQGELPSHPELLDWLALQFMESSWDVKALVKLIVMSATYRQDSRAGDELLETDPENVWLARGPISRLTSEMMRDNVLFASGLINRKIGGKSVRPYQPEGLWKMNNDRYKQDQGRKLYRRSLYTIWKRSVPNPTLATFDQPDRSECTVRRQKTSTPLQSLVLLNDPTYVEAAKVIGEKMTRSQDSENAITEAFLRLTGRIPEDRELGILLDLQQTEFRKFTGNAGKSKGWLNTGEYKIDDNLDPDMVAANAVVASLIINSDATITKR